MTGQQRCFTQVVFLLLLTATINLAGGPASAADDEYSWDPKAPVCAQTSRAAREACKNAASEGHWLSIGTCHNILSEYKREECLAIAEISMNSQLNLCSEQFKARTEVCGELGESAYDTEITNQSFENAFKRVYGNKYFPLKPGLLLSYRKVSPEGNESNLRTFFDVTNQEKKILGVTCRGVWTMTKTKEGTLKQSTLHWYAQDQEGNVWNFGETTQYFDQGVLVSGTGSWSAEDNGAMPGIAMYADPEKHQGKAFRLQFFLGKVENVVRIIGMLDRLPVLGKNTKLPKEVHGPYLHTQEVSPLNPASLANPINKFYSPGVGLVLTVFPDGTHEVLLKREERLAVRN
jgi:hypothetical protein